MSARSDSCGGKEAVEAHVGLRFRSNVGLGLRQADDSLAVLPLAALLQELDALEAFQDIALCCNGACAF
jgi:hypothetical protein